MKLSISNIGWSDENDKAVYNFMKKYGYSGLEIAPTRIFPENPYDQIKEATLWSDQLKQKYGFTVASMQSIWYGRQEKLFGSKEERCVLLEYTKLAIDFAEAAGCRNLVFGCPRNRSFAEGSDLDIGIEFFREIGNYAADHGTVIGMEANPPIYNTNYINDTLSAIELIRQVNSKGFLLNLDIGTIIQNQEDVSELEGNIQYINHVHISEPGLKPIEERELHRDLQKLLASHGYQGFVSIEMGKVENMDILEGAMQYIRSVFQ